MEGSASVKKTVMFSPAERGPPLLKQSEGVSMAFDIKNILSYVLGLWKASAMF